MPLFATDPDAVNTTKTIDPRPLLVTFSGLDGSGKSTLVAGLAHDLRTRGWHTSTLRMYDISVYSHLRQIRNELRRSARRLAGRPPEPPTRGSGPVYAFARHPTIRRLAYVGDVLSVAANRTYHAGVRRRVLLLDRYLYDLLVDVAGDGWPSLATLLAFTPHPDVPIFVDVPPERAFARKGEFDLIYLRQRQELYRWIFARVRQPVVINNDDLDLAARSVLSAVLARLA